ncbi:uracil-xanthine permease family protein [Anaerocolumna sp.]|uniref:uracil-xanthine permease family protein n=1 Tax=Anaerocolumna sp. TaxID=2041569 RepID=UPI0028B0F076|nr:nucleobase:cation symporter-2 family protein [Anaerocolumna sp.]
MINKKAVRSNTELFELNGKPSWGLAFPQAMQHVLAMLVGNITPPILIAQLLGLPESDKILLMQAAMLIGGITTLIQLFPVFGFGMGLPNVMGVAFAYMPILSAIGLSYGIKAIFGAQLVGAFASIFIGMFIGKLRKFFPPIVSGTVVLSIGLSLYTTAVNYMAGGNANADDFGKTQYWIVAIVVLAVTLACNLFGKGYIKVSGMLIGIAVGYIISLFMGNMINFDSVVSSSWIALPRFMKWGIEFHPSAIISMILMYIVQAVQTIGDVSSTTIGAFNREATDKELGGAIKGQGICGMLGACMGGLPTDPYSQNVGLIVTTKVIAKRVFTIVGGIMIVAGLCPKFGALMTTIPYPVLGGATVTVFAAITMSGIQLISQQPLNYRNKMIVGIALALGVGISSVTKSLQFLPEDVQNIIGKSPIVLAFAIAFVLNIIVPEDNTEEED